MMKRLNIVFSLVAFMVYSQAIGQNLVLNPSFEDVNTGSLNCSWYTSQTQFNNAINNWTCPTGGSTDIFNTILATSCYCSPFSTHTSSPGNQTPHTGNGFVNIVTYGNGGCAPWREYVQGELSSPLVVGTCYDVSFWVSLGDNMSLGTDNIGVKFEVGAYSQVSNCPYYTTPDLNYTGPIIIDKVNWTLISFSFTPTVAGIDHFIIGNFYNNGATNTVSSGGGSGTVIRYFVDDVVIQPCSVLPIELTEFNGNCTISGVELTWQTKSEANNDYFIVQQSENGKLWTDLGTVKGAGNSSQILDYQFSAIKTYPGKKYYRLVQVDFNGVMNYSEIISVNCKEEVDLNIFPNPARDVLTLESYNDDIIFIRLYDQLGNQVLEQKAGERKINLETANLPNGIYLVEVITSYATTRKRIQILK